LAQAVLDLSTALEAMVAFFLLPSAFADQRQLYQAGFMAPSYVSTYAASASPQAVYGGQEMYASPEYLAPQYAYPAAYPVYEQEAKGTSGSSNVTMLAVAGALVGGFVGYYTKQIVKATQPRAGNARAGSPEMKAALFYSTSTGNTETAAGYIAAATGLEAVDIGDADVEAIKACDSLIVGAPTWNTGADAERSGTSWDEFLYGDLTGLDLNGKKVAVFGMGDQVGYADNFCDAMDELASCFEKQGATIVGAWPTAGYEHEDSKSVRGDNFVGCPFDEDNQPDESEERAKKWVEQIKGEGIAI
jgi:flavodoxin I